MTDRNNRNPQEESQNKLRKLTRRRWFYPAMYLGVAALVMISVLWIQQGGGDTQNETSPTGEEQGNVAIDEDNEEAVPVNGAKEEFALPVANKDAVEVTQKFYDVNGDPEDQQAAIVTYDNTYKQSTGVNYTSKNNESFDVTAAMGGTVVKAKKDNILGKVVQIDHGNKVTTQYSSLNELKVKEGQKIKQGDVLGVSGRSSFNKDAGVHVHFEIRKKGVAVDPLAYLGKGVAALDEVAKNSDNSTEPVTESDEGSAQDDSNGQENKSSQDNSTNQESQNEQDQDMGTNSQQQQQQQQAPMGENSNSNPESQDDTSNDNKDSMNDTESSQDSNQEQNQDSQQSEE
ncbi:M23 family metallopeptidase [Tuberibacillus sp. Marseille-P3662]|uniref:M23 family metallopeptidase n=1 Tax=Tuberibacillus sp. Marseille-P3662 TaxID=1965358 RepID=UPI001594BC68|nr:M23 family metallopeptidase [Tuberibacillus sp. Marseille-P3662]